MTQRPPKQMILLPRTSPRYDRCRRACNARRNGSCHRYNRHRKVSAEVDATEDMTDTESTADTAGTGTNIVEQLEGSRQFRYAGQMALQEAGLSDALEKDGPFTIFAPTDEAFENLPPGSMDLLLKDPSGYLTGMLFYHIVGGELTTDDMVDGDRKVTQQGRGNRVHSFG